jgi:hypothetical protein
VKTLDAILITGLAALTAIDVIFVSSSVGYTYPEVAKSNIDMLPCYMETIDGRVINLISICGKSVASDFHPNFFSDPNPNYAPTPSPKLTPNFRANFNSNPTPTPTPTPTPVPPG